MKILLLDNYDSFTYNLLHCLNNIGNFSIDVIRNDKIALETINKYDKILLSPGPGIPDEAGIMKDLIKCYGHTKSILGICLGHQAIAEVYGGTLKNLCDVKHGVSDKIFIKDTNDPLYKHMSDKTFIAGRYHSWIVDKSSLPLDLIITAEDKEGNIMSLRHKEYNVYGVQYHPESIMTPLGTTILRNWIEL